MIDLHSKGWVTAPQLQESLQQHSLFSHKDDIYTFVRRFDQDSDGRFVYSDFCDAFTPRDQYFANLIGFRNADFIHRQEHKFNYFDPETRELFLRCFRVHFEIEESIELIKQRLTRRPKFTARDAFDFLDVDGHGFVTLEGLKRIFHQNKYYPTDEDLIRLVYRFDKNKNGRISYQEFVDAIMPKKSITL